MRTHALLDSGSNRHVVSERICEALGIAGIDTPMSVTTLESTIESRRRVADVEIEGVNGVKLVLNDAIYGNIIASEDDKPPTKDDVIGLTHLNDVEFPIFPPTSSEEIYVDEGETIGAIIGASHAQLWTTGEKRHGDVGQPIGVETRLGWGLLGPKNGSNFVVSCHLLSSQPCRDEIIGNIEILFARDFELIDEGAEAWSVKDRYAIKQLEETIRWGPAVGRYRASLPWKHG